MHALHEPEYSHKQTGPLWAFFIAAAIGCFALAALLYEMVAAPSIALCTGLMITFIASSFRHLAVVDHGDKLAIRFGPIPIFSRTMSYERIKSVEVGRTTWIDGLGIHWSRGGWIWNLWGRDCVVVHFEKGLLRIGTDDAANLARFLETKIAKSEG